MKSSGIHDFQESVKNGKFGEEIAKHFLTKMYLKNPNISFVTVKDVSLVKEYYFLGIDFIVYFNQVGDDRLYQTTIEIKNDSYTSNNLFVETASNSGTGRKGCMYTSQADFWLYLYENQDRGIMFKPSEVVAFVSEKNYRKVSFENKGNEHKEDYKTFGILVPVEDIVKNIPSAREVRIPIRAMAKSLGVDMSHFKDFIPYRSLIDGRLVKEPYKMNVHPTKKWREH